MLIVIGGFALPPSSLAPSVGRSHRRPCIPVFVFNVFFLHDIFFPAQLSRGFTLKDLLDKPWSRVSPPPRVHAFFVIAHRVQRSLFFDFFMLVDLRGIPPTHALRVLSACQIVRSPSRGSNLRHRPQ